MDRSEAQRRYVDELTRRAPHWRDHRQKGDTAKEESRPIDAPALPDPQNDIGPESAPDEDEDERASDGAPSEFLRILPDLVKALHEESARVSRIEEEVVEIQELLGSGTSSGDGSNPLERTVVEQDEILRGDLREIDARLLVIEERLGLESPGRGSSLARRGLVSESPLRGRAGAAAASDRSSDWRSDTSARPFHRGFALLLRATPPALRPAVIWLSEAVEWLTSSWSRVGVLLFVLWTLSTWARRPERVKLTE